MLRSIHSARFVKRHTDKVLLASAYDELVTCRRCMYWMRRYIPLAKLREHQRAIINIKFLGAYTSARTAVTDEILKE